MNTMFISPSCHSWGLTGLLERKKIRVSLSVKEVKKQIFLQSEEMLTEDFSEFPHVETEE